MEPDSSVWTALAAQGSKGKNQFKHFLTTFEDVFSSLHGQNFYFYFPKNIVKPNYFKNGELNRCHTAWIWIWIWMTKRQGATFDNGFIFEKINENEF